ncbi:hypothetical protein C2G38_2190542 [Gigaspora rosea]|uniref:Protein kinase domain-containing protein n=1 Tax=Gigaspora rosea TaxID=44941 RepID=A0A397V1D0_9GLOM|nr:hypothetical protein C2G38_2190542 [Gigaspora rosea]
MCICWYLMNLVPEEMKIMEDVQIATSPAWCQTCDPLKITQEWTSGNKSEGILELTQNATTNEYMLVFNEFGSKRNDKNGKSLECSSGNKKNIDDCIKELQLNATNYEDIIERIPFNRLDNIQKIGEEFVAVCLGGVRLIQYIKEPTHSRNPSCRVKFKILHKSKNLLEVLCEFKEDLKQLNNNSKVYGLTQNTSTDEYILVFDFAKYGIFRKCANCSRYNTYFACCQSCDPQKTTEGWTCGDKYVDNCIKEFQLKATCYEDEDCSVFSAIWLDGKRTTVLDPGSLTASRTPSSIVAIKTLPGSHENFKSYTEFRLMGSNLEVYGLTQDTTNNESLMVFQYANKGSLHTFLLSNFRELNWKSKLNQLFGISQNLKKVRKAGYVHGGFHGVRDGIAKNKDELAILKAFQSADSVIPKLSIEISICPKDKLIKINDQNDNNSIIDENIVLESNNQIKVVEHDAEGIIRRWTFECSFSGEAVSCKVIDPTQQRQRPSRRINCPWHIKLTMPKKSIEVGVTSNMGAKQIYPLLVDKYPDHVLLKKDIYSAIITNRHGDAQNMLNKLLELKNKDEGWIIYTRLDPFDNRLVRLF